MRGPIILAAGGTGGHLFPAQALAQELARRGHRCELITDRRGARYHTAAAFAGVALHTVRSGTVTPGRPLAALGGLANLIAGTAAAYRLQKQIMPAMVVGFGGYPSLPAMIAAGWLGVPRIVHEQNRVLGRANRLVASRAQIIATSFEQTDRVRARNLEKVVVTGNPVREAISGVGEVPYGPPAEQGPVRLLVLGGSQGAAVFTRVVPLAVADLPDPLRARLKVVQQCRENECADLRSRYTELGVAAEIGGFFDDMDRRLADAHLVLSRAGATTVAELAAAGRPALLVPYPGHGDAHQAANARELEERGAAWCLDERDLTARVLAGRLKCLFENPAPLTAAARAARGLARTGAASALADLVDLLASANGDHDDHSYLRPARRAA